MNKNKKINTDTKNHKKLYLIIKTFFFYLINTDRCTQS